MPLSGQMLARSGNGSKSRLLPRSGTNADRRFVNCARTSPTSTSRTSVLHVHLQGDLNRTGPLPLRAAGTPRMEAQSRSQTETEQMKNLLLLLLQRVWRHTPMTVARTRRAWSAKVMLQVGGMLEILLRQPNDAAGVRKRRHSLQRGARVRQVLGPLRATRPPEKATQSSRQPTRSSHRLIPDIHLTRSKLDHSMWTA